MAPEVANLRIGRSQAAFGCELWEALDALRVASGYKFQWRKGMDKHRRRVHPGWFYRGQRARRLVQRLL